MDNARIHRAKSTLEYLRTKKITTIYGCPYRPILNFCEQIIKAIKSKLKVNSLNDNL